MKKIIVSQKEIKISTREEVVDSLDQRMADLLYHCSCICIPMPNIKNKISTWLEGIEPHGFIFSGGGEVKQKEARFLTEVKALQYAKKHKLPVLGICRGMQLLGIYSGGELKRVENHVRTRHQLNGIISREVNSYHDFALDTCPKNYKVIAIAQDGVIEAIKHTYLPWQGWMWHPEREEPYEKDDIVSMIQIFN